MWIALVAALALAAPGDVPSREPSSSPEVSPMRELEARAFYGLGVDLLVEGEREAARALLRRVVDEYPETAWADRARGVLEVGHIPPPPPEPEPGGSPGDGRIELAVSQAVVLPALTGILLPLSLGGIEEPAVPISLALLGLGVGVGLPLAVHPVRDVTTGQAMAVLTGETLGAFYGFAGTYVVGARFEHTPAPLLVGTVGGGALGALVAWQVRPTAGQVAAVRSGVTWGAAFAASTFLLAPGRGPSGPMATRVVLLTTAGGLGGLAVGWSGELDRRRVNLVNLGGYAGVATGAALSLLVTSYGGEDPRVVFALLAGGGLAGLAGAAWLTNETSSSARDGTRLTLAPPVVVPRIGAEEHGALVQLVSGTF